MVLLNRWLNIAKLGGYGAKTPLALSKHPIVAETEEFLASEDRLVAPSADVTKIQAAADAAELEDGHSALDRAGVPRELEGVKDVAICERINLLAWLAQNKNEALKEAMAEVARLQSPAAASADEIGEQGKVVTVSTPEELAAVLAVDDDSRCQVLPDGSVVREACQCPKCGRMHRHLGNPPASIRQSPAEDAGQ
jgi:hypothetical protein